MGFVGLRVVGCDLAPIRREKEAGLLLLCRLAPLEYVQSLSYPLVRSCAEIKLSRPEHVTRLPALVLRARAQLGERRLGSVVGFEELKRELTSVKRLLDQIGKLHLDFGDVHPGFTRFVVGAGDRTDWQLFRDERLCIVRLRPSL